MLVAARRDLWTRSMTGGDSGERGFDAVGRTGVGREGSDGGGIGRGGGGGPGAGGRQGGGGGNSSSGKMIPGGASLAGRSTGAIPDLSVPQTMQLSLTSSLTVLHFGHVQVSAIVNPVQIAFGCSAS